MADPQDAQHVVIRFTSTPFIGAVIGIIVTAASNTGSVAAPETTITSTPLDWHILRRHLKSAGILLETQLDDLEYKLKNGGWDVVYPTCGFDKIQKIIHEATPRKPE